MKAPITQAQAWAVLAEHYGWADGSKAELPVLPQGYGSIPWAYRGNVFIESQLKAYGAACAAHAREMALSDAARVAAATVCDTHIPTGVKIYGSRAGKAIEALKGK